MYFVLCWGFSELFFGATPALGRSTRVGQGHGGLEVLHELPPVFIAHAIVPTQLGVCSPSLELSELLSPGLLDSGGGGGGGGEMWGRRSIREFVPSLASSTRGYSTVLQRVPSPSGLTYSPGSALHTRASHSPEYATYPHPAQRSQEPLHPYPHSQAASALKAENDHLKAEVEELRGLLTQARGQTSTLTSLLLTRFHIAQSELVVTQETARKQKQEIAELRKQVTDVEQRSFDAYMELDSANARAMRQRDCLEELEDMVCRYRDRAHVAEGLIRQYLEDKGLYEVELPSLSDLQRKLDTSEALVRCLATFAHLLYTADPANLLHYHNPYVGGLLEAVTSLLYRGSTHTPDRLPSIVTLALDYLPQAWFTHGELHLRVECGYAVHTSLIRSCVILVYA
ncbi:MAG: hypothetical protein NXY57DRAFT_968791 [Lentinula lateritia]|nr:MAG: hypothetical protein NXY57DRAFT_968791 [Lentinula lateritia]